MLKTLEVILMYAKVQEDREDPWRRKWQPTPVFLPGESQGGRSLVGYSPRGLKESDSTERLHTHTKSWRTTGVRY